MAVLALGFIGTAIGAEIGGTILGVAASSIGGFIGSAIGSMVDNMLFPVKQEGPRLSDLSVQTSTYGNVIPFIVGPENRAAGNVIWSSGLLETIHKEHSGKGGPSVDTTSYSYRASFAVGLGDCSKRGPFQAIEKIWANKKLVYDATGASSPDSAGLWSSLTFYDGSFTQMPDPVMEGYLGVGEVPAYRGTSICVIEDWQCADYGNRIPSLEFLIRADDSSSFGGVLRKIITICGFDPNTVSTSLVSGNIRGYVIGQQSSGTGAIQPLALVGNFDSAQVGGALRFQPRGNPPVASVSLDSLGGHASGEDRPSPLLWSRLPETALPREASISYPDPERDYQVNSQTARRQSGSSQNNLSNQLAVVIDATTARGIVDRMLWEAWVGRATAKAQTDDRLICLEPGRSYCFETPAGLEPLRLKAKTRGANGVIELELARDQEAAYRSTATGVSSLVPVQIVNVPGPTVVFLMDAPLFQDADDDGGQYFIVDGLASGWRGANLMRAEDGVTYAQVEPVGFESVLGTIDDMDSGPTEIFDETTVVRVTLDDPNATLESLTELEVLNGGNVAWIGDADGREGEIAQFKNADLVSQGVYDVSGWLRGRLGTEYAVATHAPGQRFALLQAGKVRRVDFGTADWNKDRDYKAVSLLTLESDATPVSFTNTGEGKRPLSPVHVTSETVASDLVISWVRRSRYQQPGLGGGPLALGEAYEAYEVDVYDGATFKRTLTSSSPTVTYLAADLATDGFISGESVTVEVFQMSDVRGRGRPGRGVLVL